MHREHYHHYQLTFLNMAGFTQTKAKKVLSEQRPTLRGQPITEKQRGLLGVVAGGGTPTRTKQLIALKRKNNGR